MIRALSKRTENQAATSSTYGSESLHLGEPETGQVPAIAGLGWSGLVQLEPASAHTKRGEGPIAQEFEGPHLANDEGVCEGYCERRPRLIAGLSLSFKTRHWPELLSFEPAREGAGSRSQARHCAEAGCGEAPERPAGPPKPVRGSHEPERRQSARAAVERLVLECGGALSNLAEFGKEGAAGTVPHEGGRRPPEGLAVFGTRRVLCSPPPLAVDLPSLFLFFISVLQVVDLFLSLGRSQSFRFLLSFFASLQGKAPFVSLSHSCSRPALTALASHFPASRYFYIYLDS